MKLTARGDRGHSDSITIPLESQDVAHTLAYHAAVSLIEPRAFLIHLT